MPFCIVWKEVAYDGVVRIYLRKVVRVTGRIYDNAYIHVLKSQTNTRMT
jgi:hypothetical protein